ncbi:hypothetical protein B0H14DRAFT_3530365 [Mycena olivaceomarginata]|nr:hypothetical protein B0H14DRAFT_3530365 [Mycena olivaceomarginata]
MALAKARGLGGYLDGTIHKPTAPTAPATGATAQTVSLSPDSTSIYSTTPSYEEWIHRDAIVLALIVLNVKNPVGLGLKVDGTAAEALQSPEDNHNKVTEMGLALVQLNRRSCSVALNCEIKLLQKNAPAVPQVNINLPPDFANFLRPVVPPAAPAPAAPNAFIPPPNTANMLIPYPHIPGADLSIQDFCSLYDLDNDICAKFQIHKYKRTNAFKFVEVDELKEMGFMKGEIAELKVAVGGYDSEDDWYSGR